MKSRVLRRLRDDRLREHARIDIGCHEIAYQCSTRSRSALRAAQVRHGRESSVLRDRQPGAAVKGVASAEDVGGVGPEAGGVGGTLVVLVAIRREDERKAR